MEFERKLRRKPPPMERKPKQTMLKELLRDDFSSCSSNGFLSYPRRQSSCYTSMRSLLDMDLKPKLPSPKEVKRTAFQKASAAVINVVRQLQFSQKQGILPRSFSRRLKMSFSKKGSVSVDQKIKSEMRVVIKVKDILRWKSFKDSLQEKQTPKPLLCSAIPSPSPSALQTTTTTGTTTTTTSSNSWSDSDFSSGTGSGSWEYCSKKYISENNKSNSVASNEDSMEEKLQETKYEEKDQFSPVSVLDFPFEEDDDSSSSFQSSLENMERTKHKLMNKIRRFENLAKIEPLDLDKRIATLEQDGSSIPSDSQSNSVHNDVEVLDQEEDEGFIKATNKAIELLNLFNATSSKECDITNDLLLDFFRDEILEKTLTKKNSRGDEFDYQLLKVAKEWMVGNNVLLDWQVEESRRVHIKEMERGGEWGRELEVERRESAMELEVEVLNMLIDEMVCDLLC